MPQVGCFEPTWVFSVFLLFLRFSSLFPFFSVFSNCDSPGPVAAGLQQSEQPVLGSWQSRALPWESWQPEQLAAGQGQAQPLEAGLLRSRLEAADPHLAHNMLGVVAVVCGHS